MLEAKAYGGYGGEGARWRVRGMTRAHGFPETRHSLLREIRDGAVAGGLDGGATWRDFFDLYAPPVYRVARMRGLERHDAEDIVQQVMMAVLAHIEGFRFQRDRGRFRSWIRRIAENKITDLFRKQGREPRVRPGSAGEHEECPTDPDEVWERQWRQQDLLYCLQLVEADIAPRRMEAFRLYVLRGVPAEETAKRLGMTIGHVYAVRSLVMSMLRKRMAELEPADEGEGL